MSVRLSRPPYRITTEVPDFDLDQVWRRLRGSYWAMEITRPNLYLTRVARVRSNRRARRASG